MEVVTIDLKKCNLSKDLAQNRPEWRNRILVANPTQLGQGFDDDDKVGHYPSKLNPNDIIPYKTQDFGGLEPLPCS